MSKTIIYQLLPRYWGAYEGGNVRGGSLEENGCGHFCDIDDQSLDYFKSLGCSHIWLTGVIRHATSCDTAGCKPSHPQFIKGRAGSPYAISDYYDVNPYLATDPGRRMEEFKSLIRRIHSHGLKVLIDFVPNHVSRDNVNLGANDDFNVHWCESNDFFYYPGERLVLPTRFVKSDNFPSPYEENPAKATGNNCFTPYPGINDWYETVKINYCDFHTGTWEKMLDILLFWSGLGVDGFRCDMVELVPAQFFTWAIAKVKERYENVIFIAEVYIRERYNDYLRNVGFDYLYDKSGVYDALRDIVYKNVTDPDGPVSLYQSTRRLTANWQFLGDLQPQMLNFIENHDEQRAACSEFGTDAPNCYSAAAMAALFNTSPFMLYFGQEVGEKGEYDEGFSGNDGRTSIFDWWKIESVNRLNRHIHGTDALCREEKSVLEHYMSIMRYAALPQFSSGRVFDLCYCNVTAPGFNPDRHFAFIRYDSDAAYVVFCNFSPKDASAELYLPPFDRKVAIGAKAFDFSVVEL